MNSFRQWNPRLREVFEAKEDWDVEIPLLNEFNSSAGFGRLNKEGAGVVVPNEDESFDGSDSEEFHQVIDFDQPILN